MITTEQRDARKTGVYYGMPAREYHALPGASASRLRDFSRSAAHALHKMRNPSPPTPEMIFGTAVHALTLEGDSAFNQQFAVPGPCSCVTGKGSPCGNAGKYLVAGEWRCGVHAKNGGMSEDGRIVLAQEDRDRAFRVRDSIMAHPAARWIIQTKSAVEVSALWDCPETGVRCKLRADILGNGMAGDIKTTTDASPDSFMRTIASWSYHFQATHYINGLTALDLPIEHFCFIAVEKEEPFAVAVYRLRDDVLELVRPKLRGMLYKWKRCEEEGRWPAYSDEIQDIGIERWAAAKLEQI